MAPVPETITAALTGHRVSVSDIGVRGGFAERWRTIDDVVDLVGIEADTEECARLERSAKAKQRFLPYVLDASHSRRTLHVCRAPGCSSLYEPNAEFTEPFSFGWALAVERQLDVETTTLDDICAAHGIAPDAIKVDTQGSELDVLRGGKQAVDGALFLELEVEFNPMYKGQPLFADVDLYLREQGFRLLALRRSYWRFNGTAKRSEGGHLIHGDVLYYREAYRDLDRMSQVKLALILACYRQYDFAAHLARRLGLEDETLRALIPSAPLLSRMIGRYVRGRVHGRLRRMADNLRYDARDWHDPTYW